MSLRLKAFATLAAVGLLVLTIALLAGAVLSSRQLLLEQARSETSLDSRSAAWEVVGKLLSALQATWNADEETLPSWWTGHSSSFPAGCDLQSLSSRINLNSLSPFLLQNSSLGGTLLGKSVADFVTFRTNNGPFTSLGAYKGYFQPETLNTLYCTYSLFNGNTADEIMLEKVITLRTGDTAYAATIRARVREFRTALRTMTGSDLDVLLGNDKDAIGDLVTIEPELDVNTAPLPVLQAIFRDQDFKLTEPDAKLQIIVAGRASKPLTTDALQRALGVDKDSLLLQYLGTRCRFLQGTVTAGTAVIRFVALVRYSADSPPKPAFRIMDTLWASS